MEKECCLHLVLYQIAILCKYMESLGGMVV